MVHDMHTRRRRPDYLQACPTEPPVDGVKSALTSALWPCAALWPCTFCSDPAGLSCNRQAILEPEIVHNKEFYYKTIDGKEARKLTYIPCYHEYENLFFKPANDVLVTYSRTIIIGPVRPFLYRRR